MSAEDPPYQIEDIVLGVLALLAPDAVKRGVVRLISQTVSQKAGDEAQEMLEDVDLMYDGSASKFLVEVNKALAPELEGAKEAPKVSDFDELMAVAMTLEVAATRPPHAVLPGEQSALQGCDCYRCGLLKSLQKMGVNIVEVPDPDAPAPDKKDLN